VAATIIDNDHLNAYASPEGTFMSESGLGPACGPSTGLWAAVLSHEIAHVGASRLGAALPFRNLWAVDGGGGLVLGDPGSLKRVDRSQKASQRHGSFLPTLGVEADHDGSAHGAGGLPSGLRAGAHHLLHARGLDAPAVSFTHAPLLGRARS